MSFGAPATPPLPVPPGAPPPPPLFGEGQTQGQKPGRKSSQPTFLGGEARPQGDQLGIKTLLGQ